MSAVEVVVVGGGVAGGATACALGARGLAVAVIERKRTESTVNRGEVLHGQAQALLERWGIWPEFEAAVSERLQRYRIHQQALGTVADFDQRGDVVVPHPVIEELLLSSAESKFNARVVRGAAARDLVLDGGRVVGVRARAADGDVDVRAALVVGADGSGSFVRSSLKIACPATPYEHELCYAEAPRMQDMRGNEIYLGRRGFVMRRPIGPDRMRVSFATRRGEGARLLRLSEDDLGDYLGRRWPVFRGWRINREGRHVYTLTRQHADEYWRPGAVLVGDAAHVNHPATGTGMHMAMEDAEALADQVTDAVASPHRLDAALGSYQEDRRPKVAANIARTHEVASFVMTPGVRAATRRLAVLGTFKGLRVSRKIPLLALPSFSVPAVLRAAFRRRVSGVGVYR
jgi:2-polyprenyl-6-methoxyphenol hydroxylase-like FAD-dependent oxidoreductase